MTPPEPYQLIEKAMGYNDSGKDYFTKDDWVFACQIWPNLRWTIEESEQTLYALLEEGKVREIEGPGSEKFELTEELSTGTGGTFKA